MKKLRTILFIFLLLFAPLALVSAYTSEQVERAQLASDLLQQLQNRDIQSKISEEQYSNYKMILVELSVPLNQQTSGRENSDESWDRLGTLLTDQLDGLIQLQQELKDLSKDNVQLMTSLQNCQNIIEALRKDLEIALDRIGDAEGGAIAILDQNTELYNQNKQLEKFTNELRKEIGKMERRAAIQPYVVFGGVGVGVVGGGFIGAGVMDKNWTNVGIGVGVIGVDILVYSLGRWVFKWF